jgi:hypothetical protein
MKNNSNINGTRSPIVSGIVSYKSGENFSSKNTRRGTHRDHSESRFDTMMLGERIIEQIQEVCS